ncbi:S-layer homology domain-containing protein [Bacillus sp. Marseille-P3661]|uniref:S-layer homology domain-containing protein n=1 Tax=Bacillus sp. Marseille-P3661 TaxID=1936234 RepID=UPI000C830FA5|nr:S-layer homology domain-containing protein [Bacillus sp. Marseille-P3661]
MTNQSKKINKFVTAAAGAAVVVSAVAPAAGAAWTNTPDWMKDSLQDLVNYGVIDADATVRADGEVTRGEVALYFARALNLDMENVENPGFADVPTSHKYYKAIAALAEAGKMNGTKLGFEPDRVINRAEMASLLVKAFGYEYGNGESLKFTDMQGAEWAKNAIAALVDANIVSGVNEAKTLFAPMATLTRQDTAAFLHKTMVAQGVNFAALVKQVDAVTAVTTKGVDVVFPKVEEAREDVTITVLDPNGNEVAVKPVNLEIGDTEISFTFEKELDEVANGMWVVGGVEFDTAAVAAVKEVNEASNQVELYEALSSSYFNNVKSDNIVKYQEALNAADEDEKNSVAKIQAIINDVNQDIVSLSDKEDAVKAVKDAGTNQLELLAALHNFDRVNADWIVEYQAALPALDGEVEATYELLQNMIDTVNETEVDAAITAAVAGLDAEDVEDAIELVEDFIKADDEEKKETAKADRIETLELHAALINITAANTNAKLMNALQAYADLNEDFDTDIINDTLLKEYRHALAAVTTAADKNEITEIIEIFKDVHTAAIADAVDAIAALNEDASTADVKAAFQKLADVSKTTQDAFDMDTVVEESLEDYLTELVGATIETQADVEGVIAFVNNPTNALAEINTALANAATTADQLFELLQDNSLTLNNLVEANKAHYLAEKDLLAAIVADITTTSELTNDQKAEKVAAVKDVVTAENALVEINDVTSVTAMKAELDQLAVAGVSMADFTTEVTAYIDLSTTAKLEVAELIVETKTEFNSVEEVVDAITAQISARNTMLSAVNNAGIEATISEMDAALEAVDYDAYNKLSAVQQIAVAEAFVNNFPTETVNNTEAQVNYTTLTAIRADIDKAIAQVK